MDAITSTSTLQIKTILGEWYEYNRYGRISGSDIPDQADEKTKEIVIAGLFTRMCDAIYRFAPERSAYALNAYPFIEAIKEGMVVGGEADMSDLRHLVGILEALKDAYADGYMTTLTEIIDGEVFSDLLDTADHHLQLGQKDAAAVVLGSVLEEHLRRLCMKHNLPVTREEPDASVIRLKTADLNTELKTAGAYKLELQKQVSAWLEIRNNAGLGRYANYSREQVVKMSEGIRALVRQYPA
jgi:hypothetical protein